MGSSATALVGVVVAQDQQRKAAGERKKAGRIGRAQQAAVEARTTRQQIREERVKRAQILAAAENTGVAGASSEAGSLSAMRTSVGSNIAFRNEQTAYADAQSKKLQNAADLDRKASNTLAFTKIASSAVSAFGKPAPDIGSTAGDNRRLGTR